MPLHPQAARSLAMVAGAPPLDTQTAEASRAGLRTALPLTGAPTALADVTDTTLPSPSGAVPVRVYRPSRAAQLPVVAYFHGGGWLMGDLDSHDTTCRDIARHAEAVVVAVHYRRPPEHPFPAAYEDCLAVTKALLECDPLRDDGEAYAAALRAASVPVEYRCFEGQVHAFVMLGGIIDAAHEARRLMGERLRQSFARAP